MSGLPSIRRLGTQGLVVSRLLGERRSEVALGTKLEAIRTRGHHGLAIARPF